MGIKKILLTVSAIMITTLFENFVQKTYCAEEPNAPAQKQKRVEGERRVRRRMPMGDRVQQRMTELNGRLNLTDEQKNKIRPIIENEIKEMQGLRADSALSKEEKIEKMKAIRETTQGEIKAILTPEQQKKLAEVKEEIREDVKEDIVQHIQHRMTVLSEQLNLTDEQKKKIEPIIENEIKEIAAVKDDEGISKEQKQEKMRAIRQKAREEIKKVLTPEQQRKLALEREKGRGRITEKSKK